MVILVIEDSIQILTQLGLTSAQSRLYINLVVFGVSTVERIAKLSGTDRGITYQILTDLVEDGLVQKIMDSPIKYRSISLEKGLSILLEGRKQEDFEIKKRIKEWLINYPAKDCQTISVSEEPSLFVTNSRLHLNNMLSKKIVNLQKSYDVAMDFAEFDSSISNDCKEYQKLLSRGVRCRIVIESYEGKKYYSKTFESLQKNANFESRLYPVKIPMRLGIYDDREVRIGISTNDRKHRFFTYWSDSPIFVVLAKSWFETLWRMIE